MIAPQIFISGTDKNISSKPQINFKNHDVCRRKLVTSR